jgi:hypothetical protein
MYFGCSIMKILKLSGEVINWEINDIMSFFEYLVLNVNVFYGYEQYATSREFIKK